MRKGPAERHSMSLPIGNPPATEFPRQRSRCPFPAVHLARNPRESVSGGISRRPPGTESPRKRVRWHLPAAHLARQFLSSWDVGAFQQDKLVVCSMKRVAVCTSAAAKYMHLSENHDVSRMVQLRVSHVWTHLQLQNDLTDAYRAYLSLRVC